MSKTRKPELKTELVRAEYWSCGEPAHRHQSESVASKCVAKQERVAGHRKWMESDYTQLLAQFRSGTRKVDLARQLGLSATQ